jgi:hypothetical protein
MQVEGGAPACYQHRHSGTSWALQGRLLLQAVWAVVKTLH